MNTVVRTACGSRWLRPALAAVLLAVLTPALPGAPADAEPKKPDTPATPATPIEAQFTDGSRVKLMLKDEKLEVNTRYGKLLIPVAEVRRIEFATRVAEDVQKRIDAAILKLGSEEHAAREAASAELFQLGAVAYPALMEAAKSKDPEVVRRAEEVLAKVREKVPANRLEPRKDDVIHTTDDSKFTGRIAGATLKVGTAAFGEQQVKLTDLVALGGAAPVPVEVVNAMADPGTMYNHNNEVGKTFVIRVTGNATGSVWGTDVYTSDSTIATAAVHAGLVAPGQTGVVKVMMLVSPPAYVGSTRNGVTTRNYGAFNGAYQFVK